MGDSEKKTNIPNEVRYRGSENQPKHGGPPIMTQGPPAAGGAQAPLLPVTNQDAQNSQLSSRDDVAPLNQGNDLQRNDIQGEPNQPDRKWTLVLTKLYDFIVETTGLVTLTKKLAKKLNRARILYYNCKIVAVACVIVLILLIIGFVAYQIKQNPDETLEQIFSAFFSEFFKSDFFERSIAQSTNDNSESPDYDTQN